MRGERLAIDQVRLHVRTHELDGARHQRLDRIGHVMRLVEHVRGIETRQRSSSASTSSLNTRNSWNGFTDPASRSSSPNLLSLKWNPPSLPNWMRRATICSISCSARDARDRPARTRAAPARARSIARAPVAEDHRVERRFVRFVLEKQAPAGRQLLIDGPEAVEIAIEGLAEMQLTGKVAPIADPHGMRSGAQAQPDLQALEILFDGLTSHGLVDMRQAAVFVTTAALGDPGTCSSSSTR